MPYLDQAFVRLEYKHETWKPGINGGLEGAATLTLGEDCLVRVPVRTKMFNRALPKAVWREDEDVLIGEGRELGELIRSQYAQHASHGIDEA